MIRHLARAAFLLCASTSASAADRALFLDAAVPATPRTPLDTAVARSRTARFDVAALAAPVERVQAALFDDRVATLVVTRRTDQGAARFTWSGTVEGDPLGSASFAVDGDAVCGTVRLGRELYRLSGANGVVEIEQVVEAALPPCSTTSAQRVVLGATPNGTGSTSVPSSGATGSRSTVPQGPGSSALATAGETIDVMVVWTPQARAGQGGVGPMQALIDLAVLETNDAYAASGVLQRLRLVHRAELVGFVESGNFAVDMGKVQNPSDGVADEATGWRNASGADCVVLIVDAGGSCGVAYLMGTLDPAWEAFAFCAVARNCATGNYTFGHELGHVMGLAHDRDNSSDKTTRISTNQQLQPANNASYSPGISSFGTYVAFVSDASNLVAGDTNNVADVFLRDRANRTTVRVNVGAGGVQANGFPVSPPVVSLTGQQVAFDSTSTNLVANDTNGVSDVFVRNTLTATTERVSVATGGAQGTAPSREPALSDDGRFVAFTSQASNFGSPGTQVYVRDRLAGTTVLASVALGGGGGIGASSRASISSDGRYVAFTSESDTLVAGDVNGVPDAFVRDLVAGTTVLASVGVGGAVPNGPTPVWTSLSANGRYVAFSSLASNLVASDLNGTWDVFVRDLQLGTTVRASVGLGGAEANGPSGWVSKATVSNDGRFVALLSRASNLVVGDTNGFDDVFVRDLQLGVTFRVNVTPSGQQAFAPSGSVDQSNVAALSPANGDSIAFVSSAVLETLDGNAFQDVYVHQRSEPNPAGVDSYSFGYRTPDQQWRTIMSYAPGVRVQRFSNPSVTWAGQALGIADPDPFSAEAWKTLNNTASTVAAWRGGIYAPFCVGDGTGSACPCGNESSMDAGAGCLNSLGLAGKLEAMGVASLAGDSARLSGSGMPNSSVLYFQGTTQQAGGSGSSFGDGLRCAGGTVRRLRTKTNTSNASVCPETSDPALSTLGALAAPGTVHYQAWYRNSAAFCTVSAFNLTNGLSITWQP